MHKTLIAAACAAVLAGCAGTGPSGSASDAAVRAKAVETMKTSFKERGIAKLDRLDQDETQSVCSQYSTAAPPKEVAERIEKANMALVKPPSDGKYLGDWKRGEQIAQRGTGFQYSDTRETPVGGNCYACHELSKAEISYGTIGPSLHNFAKIRGYGPDIQKYAWGKVYNAHAYTACSFMPRFGAQGILSEQQLKDVVALLMDPESPVNK
ncbi:MAG: sulfur oxidation c-type cytochrome SoxX [Betaproteobacteria bacterium]|jgi:sulfur-oxidizing protein SoxX|nr:sulfur oxidation c-type cytochrome SoxX [Betaproteobacteria bacterium]